MSLLPKLPLAVLPVLVLLATPSLAAAASQVAVQQVGGVNVVVVTDDGSAGEIQTARGIDMTAGPFTAVESLGGATAGAGCTQATPTIVGCAGNFPTVIVNGNGGNDKITLELIAEGLSPQRGQANGGDGNDELRSPPDFRDVPQPTTLFEGGPGNDTIVTGNGADDLRGGDGNDTMQSFEGPDAVRGEGGDDSVSAGKEEPEANAADVLDGGPGFDSIPDVDADYTRGFDDDVSVTMDGQPNDGEAGEGDNVTAVEKLRVQAQQATVSGTEGADDIFVEAYTGSTIRGLGGNDRLVAYDANDNIEGGDGDDYLEGGFGNDTLDGGPGVDQFNGDRTETDVFAVGNDQIRARDGNAEQVSCGLGSDTAQVDALDVVDSTCESVDRSAANAFGAKTLVTLALSGGRIPARGPVKVRIANANPFAVTGSVSGQTVKRVTVSAKRKVKLKAKRFSVGAGARKTVKLKLPAALRRALKRTGKLALRMTVRVKDPAGNTRTVKKRITPKLKR
jgi:Ca2+-binding RTX toxin-like protein